MTRHVGSSRDGGGRAVSASPHQRGAGPAEVDVTAAGQQRHGHGGAAVRRHARAVPGPGHRPRE
ncbi:hypothetical protein TOK_2308 [Pseudonocardia sp. N23]|nr:hypothetical protein TOK_2308 [Pseudonocardia sp. N23]